MEEKQSLFVMEAVGKQTIHLSEKYSSANPKPKKRKKLALLKG